MSSFESKSLQETRAEIQAAICEELSRDIVVSERAAIVFEHLIYDSDFTSWQIKMLNSIFQITPAIYRQIVESVPPFANFNYNKISKTVCTFKMRSSENSTTDFRGIVSQLFGEPDPGDIGVLRIDHEYSPKKSLIGNIVTVDHLVLLLFWNLYSGRYVSDVAIGILSLARRKRNYGKHNRWYLDTFEGLSTETEIIDYSYSDQQWILFHDGSKVRLRPFGAWGINQLEESPLPDGSLWIARGDVLQPPSRFSEEKIQELEHLINTNGLEKDFQEFFERNPEFLMALGNYKGIHPQMILHEDDGRKLIPDFFLEKLNSDFCDILDLKRAHMQLTRKQNSRNRFRDAVMEGVAQLEHYRNWFEDRRHRDDFHRKHGLKLYRPKVVLIIGRKDDFFDEIRQIQIQNLVREHCEIRTYDDVVASARHYLSLMSGSR